MKKWWAPSVCLTQSLVASFQTLHSFLSRLQIHGPKNYTCFRAFLVKVLPIIVIFFTIYGTNNVKERGRERFHPLVHSPNDPQEQARRPTPCVARVGGRVQALEPFLLCFLGH